MLALPRSLRAARGVEFLTAKDAKGRKDREEKTSTAKAVPSQDRWWGGVLRRIEPVVSPQFPFLRLDRREIAATIMLESSCMVATSR